MSKSETQILIVTSVTIGLIILFMLLKKSGTDNFEVRQKTFGQPCKIDEDCGDGDFCYMGQCWGYWKGYPMPWSTCRNPYCTSVDPSASCNATQGKCSPYCKCTMNRRLGGSISADCFPTCGKPCLSNDNCPPGCPACSHGICSAPNKPTPVL